MDLSKLTEMNVASLFDSLFSRLNSCLEIEQVTNTGSGVKINQRIDHKMLL